MTETPGLTQSLIDGIITLFALLLVAGIGAVTKFWFFEREKRTDEKKSRSQSGTADSDRGGSQRANDERVVTAFAEAFREALRYREQEESQGEFREQVAPAADQGVPITDETSAIETEKDDKESPRREIPIPPEYVFYQSLTSYLFVRRVIGAIGIGLPPALAIWGFYIFGRIDIEGSISSYYYLRTRDIFVPALITIGILFFVYRGYDWRERMALNIAGMLAFGYALFPSQGSPMEVTVHFASWTGMFLILAYFSYFLFTRTTGFPSPQKTVRNRLYRASGLMILGCVILVFVLAISDGYFGLEWLLVSQPIFWLESLAFVAFGTAWLVKGEVLLRDTTK